MNRYKILRLTIFVLMLSLVAGSGLAQELQAAESAGSLGVNANLAANAPWFSTEIDTPGNTGKHTSIAIDPATGRTYISYYDYTNKNLRLAMSRFSGSGGNCGPNNSWTCQTVDDTYGVGEYSSIDINPVNGEVGIAYYDATNGQLKYAHGEICATCPWSKDIIDKPIAFPLDNMGKYASLKFNQFGAPSIAYYFEITSGVDSLMTATYVGGNSDCGSGTAKGWVCSTIQSGEGVGQYASLAIDGDGHRHIAYYDGANGDLWYTTSRASGFCNGNTWLCYSVDSNSDVGQFSSLFLDENKDFHIAYYDATADKLKYAFDIGSGGNCGVFGSAQCDTIDSMADGSYPHGISIAEDIAGYPVIAYQDDFGALNLARPLAALGLVAGSGNCGPENPFSTWHCKTIRPYLSRISARQADYVSIAIHDSGLGTIAYNGFIQLSDSNLALAYQRFQVFEPIILYNP